MQRAGFTMMELIFVIVVIGILAGIAVTKLNFGRNDAEIVNARVQIASVKAAIVSVYNDNLLRGKPSYPDTLDSSDGRLFGAVLPMGGIKQSSGKNGWKKSGENYIYTLNGGSATFAYNKISGTLTCSGSLCNSLE